MNNPDTIDWYNSQLDTTYFPIITFDDGMLDSNLYQELKNTFPNLKHFKTTNSGQTYRKNIELRLNGTKDHKHNIKMMKTKYPKYHDLFIYLTSQEFKTKLFEKFKDTILKKNGFIGNIKQSSILMQVCESTGGYENPFHVDSRKRIVHGLLYFGKDTITQGGELCIAKHKEFNKLENYPQYPTLSNIEQITAFPPDDNFGLFVLSTPNSYHKGNSTQGIRRFLYISLDYTGGNKIAWKCGWTRNTKTFKIGLKQQKNEKNYDKFQQTISNTNE